MTAIVIGLLIVLPLAALFYGFAMGKDSERRKGVWKACDTCINSRQDVEKALATRTRDLADTRAALEETKASEAAYAKKLDVITSRRNSLQTKYDRASIALLRIKEHIATAEEQTDST